MNFYVKEHVLIRLQDQNLIFENETLYLIIYLKEIDVFLLSFS